MDTQPLKTQNLSLSALKSSRILGFAKMSPQERIEALISNNILNQSDADAFSPKGSLDAESAENFIENCIGTFTLPLGIATNFLIDNEEILVPMAVEESSVIAAASFGAKLARHSGGFVSNPPRTISTCQIQFFVTSAVNVQELISEKFKEKISEICSTSFPKLLQRGGGIYDIELRNLNKPGYYVLHIHVDTCEAMGANIVNTIAENVGLIMPDFFPCSVGSKILTNLALHRVTTVKCEIDFKDLARGNFSGEEVANRVCAVYEFADLDPFRATTHNKGVMNGIDPIVIATGNDWRAVEAGCHAYASLSGTYKPLTKWFINHKKKLQGEITMPICVGTVGGVTRLHPSAKASLKILGYPTSAKLSVIMASVGLAQNLSALRALGCEGIQKGHMALHEKNLSMMRQYDNMPVLPITPNHQSDSDTH